MGGKERLSGRLRTSDQLKADVVWTEAYLSILELPKYEENPGALSGWSSLLPFPTCPASQVAWNHLVEFGIVLSRPCGCVKFPWSESLQNSCPPLASDQVHWTWPRNQKEGCCQMASGCERLRGSYVGSNSRGSVSRHWWKQERWKDKQRFMRKQNAMAASKDSLLFPRAASAGLEKSLQLMLPGDIICLF